MDIVSEITNLKKSVDNLLKGYNVPMDDRLLVVEKIEESMVGVLQAQKLAFDQAVDKIKEEIGTERDNVRKQVDDIKVSAVSELSKIKGKINDAYDEGLEDGMSQATPASQGPSAFVIVLGIFFATLAFTVVAGTLFSSKEKKN